MNEVPINGLYFIIRVGRSSGYMIGKVINKSPIDEGYDSLTDWRVRVIATDICDYKSGQVVDIHLYNNSLINVEYFKSECELLARVI